MSRRRQEHIEDWEQDTRDLARAERELRIEHWVRVSIGYLNARGETVILYGYDLPRGMHERYRWVIRWRTARLQCLYPRESVCTYYGYYDKRTGLKTDFNSCLHKLAAAKAQITKARRSEENHIAAMKNKYPMFYNPDEDAELIKYRIKLGRKVENCRELEESIRQAVDRHQQEHI